VYASWTKRNGELYISVWDRHMSMNYVKPKIRPYFFIPASRLDALKRILHRVLVVNVECGDYICADTG